MVINIGCYSYEVYVLNTCDRLGYTKAVSSSGAGDGFGYTE